MRGQRSRRERVSHCHRPPSDAPTEFALPVFLCGKTGGVEGSRGCLSVGLTAVAEPLDQEAVAMLVKAETFVEAMRRAALDVA